MTRNWISRRRALKQTFPRRSVSRPTFERLEDRLAMAVLSLTATQDTTISIESPNSNYGSNTLLQVDGSPDEAALLKWDLSAIPAGSTIQNVTLTVNLTDNSDDTYEIYRLKRDWQENQTTWNNFAAGSANRWQSAGADGSLDRDPTVLGRVTGDTGSRTFSLNTAGVAVVQSWVNNTAANFGFIIQDYEDAINGLDFRSREFSTATSRPRLNVTYVTNSPSLSPIGSKSGDELAPLSFTASATDPNLPNDTLTYSLVAGSGVGGTPVPAGATIDPTSGVFTWTPNETQDGSYSFRVRVTDSTGQFAEEQIAFTIAEVNNFAPVLPPIGDVWGTQGFPLSFAIAAASDADVINGSPSTLTYSVDDLPPGSSFDANARIFSWTPAAAGVFPITFTVSDGSATATQTINITVAAPGNPQANHEIYYVRSTDGGATFGTYYNLSNSPADNGTTHVAAANGIVAVVFDTVDQPREVLQVMSNDGGTSFTVPFNLSSNNGDSSENHIAAYGNALGTLFMGMWEEDVLDANGNPIANLLRDEAMLRRSNNGLTWSTTQNLSNSPGAVGSPAPSSLGHTRDPVVSISSSLAAAVFEDVPDPAAPERDQIMVTVSTNGGTTWTTPLVLSNAAVQGAEPCVAVEGNSIHVVYEDRTFGIMYARSTDGGASFTHSLLGPVPANFDKGAPYIAVSGGTVHVVLVEDELVDGVPGLYYMRSTDHGDTWSTPVQISDESDLTTATAKPTIAVNGDNVYVTWQDERASGSDIEVMYRRSADGGLTFEAQVNISRNNGESGEPHVTVDPSDGNVYIVWYDNSTPNPPAPALINQAPDAVNDSLTVALNGGDLVNVLANDTDPENGPYVGAAFNNTLTVIEFTQPDHGVVSQVGLDSFSYTPESGYSGPDSFTYTIRDAQGVTDVGTVNITVSTNANQPPVANNDSLTTFLNTAGSVNVLSNDTEPEGGFISVTGFTQPTNGTVTQSGARGEILTYTPNAGFAGIDSFTYTASDFAGLTDPATVNVLVNPVAAPPAQGLPQVNNDVFYLRSTDGGATFQTFYNVSNSAAANNLASVAAANGVVSVIYGEGDPAGEVLLARSVDGGGTFAPIVNLSNTTAEDSGQANLAASANAFVAAWSERVVTPSSGPRETVVRYSGDGGLTWTTIQNLSNTPTTASVNPRVAVFGSLAVAVYVDVVGGNNEVMVTRSTNGGLSWSTPINLSNDNNASESPAIYMDGNNVHVVWEKRTVGVNYSVSTDGGATFSTPVLIPLTNARAPSVIAAGTKVTVLFRDNTANRDIYVARSTNTGVSFTAPSVLYASGTTDAAFQAGKPMMALSGSNLYIVWEETHGPGTATDVKYMRSTDGGATFGPAFNLSNNVGASQDPSIAVDPVSGNVYVAWLDNSTPPPSGAPAPASLPGDFNGDGSVDAADYVVWRENGGSQAEYDLWRANFGNTSPGSGTGASISLVNSSNVSVVQAALGSTVDSPQHTTQSNDLRTAESNEFSSFDVSMAESVGAAFSMNGLADPSPDNALVTSSREPSQRALLWSVTLDPRAARSGETVSGWPTKTISSKPFPVISNAARDQALLDSLSPGRPDRWISDGGHSFEHECNEPEETRPASLDAVFENDLISSM